MNRRPAVRRRVLPGSPFNVEPVESPPAEVFVTGDQVTHDRYGLGTVVGLEHNSVVVDFGAEVRRIAIPNPKLTRL
jgi:hypothetical protein